MDEEDSVVDEVDVHLSKTLAENLFIFQFPVRPGDMTYDDVTVLDARAKPKQQKVELELALNIDNSTYDRGKGEQFVVNINCNSKLEEPYFKSKYMDKQTLVSSRAVNSTSRYAVGVIRDGDLHMSAIEGIIQLRPSFSFLDLSDPKIRPDGQDAGDGDMSMEGDGDDDDMKPVTVKFARRETDRAKAARERSFGFLQKKMSEEAWVKLKYNSVCSESSRLEFNRLQCVQPDEKAPELHVSPKDYLQMLLPEDLETDFAKPNLPPSAVMSMVHLRTMPLGDQIRNLLGNAKVLKFHQLMTLLPTDVDPMTVIRALQQVAVLVQGCWVVKSEVLYPKDSFSVHSGIIAEVLCRARDYIMWRFTQSSTITRKEVTSLVKLPQDDIKEILEQMARVRPIKGWEFILSRDDSFIKRYPEVVQRQQMLWDAKYLQLAKTMKLPKSGVDAKSKGDGAENVGMKSPAKPRQRRRTKSSQEGDTSDDASSEAKSSSSRCDVKPLVKRTLAGGGVSPRALAARLEPMETDVGIPVLNGVASGDAAVGELDVQMRTHFNEELRNFVLEKLRMVRSVSLSDLKMLLNSKLADSPPGHILGRGVTTKMMEAALQDVGAEHINANWPLDWEQDPIYTLGSLGEERDVHRQALLNLYRSGPRHRKALIKKKVEEETGVHLTDKDFGELLKPGAKRYLHLPVATYSPHLHFFRLKIKRA